LHLQQRKHSPRADIEHRMRSARRLMRRQFGNIAELVLEINDPISAAKDAARRQVSVSYEN